MSVAFRGGDWLRAAADSSACGPTSVVAPSQLVFYEPASVVLLFWITEVLCIIRIPPDFQLGFCNPAVLGLVPGCIEFQGYPRSCAPTQVSCDTCGQLGLLLSW